jgi:hypothetical protein
MRSVMGQIRVQYEEHEEPEDPLKEGEVKLRSNKQQWLAVAS